MSNVEVAFPLEQRVETVLLISPKPRLSPEPTTR